MGNSSWLMPGKLLCQSIILFILLSCQLGGLLWSHEIRINSMQWHDRSEADTYELLLFLHETSLQVGIAAQDVELRVLKGFKIPGCDATARKATKQQDLWTLAVDWECEPEQESFMIDASSWLINYPDYSIETSIYRQKTLLSSNWIDRDSPTVQWIQTTAAEQQSLLAQAQLTWSYLKLGISHIFAGRDHVLFLLALLLLIGLNRIMWYCMLGFTLGHAATIISASFGWLSVSAPMVEMIIAWSILQTAAESYFRHTLLIPVALALSAAAVMAIFTIHWPTAIGLGILLLVYYRLKHEHFTGSFVSNTALIAITSMFGLYHGLGFSQILIERLSQQSQILPSLIGFNLGVELGQVGIIGLFLLITWLLSQLRVLWLKARGKPEQTAPASSVASLLDSEQITKSSSSIHLHPNLALVPIFMGTYWFILRVFG